MYLTELELPAPDCERPILAHLGFLSFDTAIFNIYLITFVMKHIIKIAATHVAASVALIGSFGLVYAAWNTPVNNGDSLSASRWNDLVAQIQALDAAAVPAGAVISFNLTACPTGWDEYIPAR